MIARLSLRTVLDDAVAAGLLPPDVLPAARAALIAKAQDEMPWYLRLLMGGAAWVAALFMLSTVLGLIALALGERVDLAALVLGLILMPAGVRMRAMRRGEFVQQASLVGVIAGQLLVLGAIGSLSDSGVVAAIATVASTVALIIVFDETVYRFAGTLAILGAKLFLAFEWKVPYAMGLVTAATACVPVVIWRLWPGPAGTVVTGWPQPLNRILEPVAWACATAACGLLALQAVIDAVTGTVGYPPGFVALLLPRPWPLTVVFVALLLWLATRIASEHGAALTDPTLMVAMVASAALGFLTLSTPAVCGALLLLLLGFDRRRTGLVALGAAFLVAFLGLYYYSLALSLLQKSAVLIASGAVCLAAAAFFRSRQTEAVA